MCNNFAQIRKQHHLEKIPGKESENLYEHTILESVKIPKLQNVTYMTRLSFYSRWQTFILTFACFVDFFLGSFQHLVLGMICAINEKIKTVAIYVFFFLKIGLCKIVDDLCISFLTQSLSSPRYQRKSKLHMSFFVRVGHQWGGGDHVGRTPFRHQLHPLHWRCE